MLLKTVNWESTTSHGRKQLITEKISASINVVLGKIFSIFPIIYMFISNKQIRDYLKEEIMRTCGSENLEVDDS